MCSTKQQVAILNNDIMKITVSYIRAKKEWKWTCVYFGSENKKDFHSVFTSTYGFLLLTKAIHTILCRCCKYVSIWQDKNEKGRRGSWLHSKLFGSRSEIWRLGASSSCPRHTFVTSVPSNANISTIAGYIYTLQLLNLLLYSLPWSRTSIVITCKSRKR